MKTVKKIFAVLLILGLILSLSVSAFAVNAQYGPTKAFLKVMDREGHKYNYMGIDEDDDEQIKVTFEGDYLDDINVNIYFDEDLDSVSMCSWYIIEFDEADLPEVLKLVNKLNNDYKFVRFQVDEKELSAPLRQQAEVKTAPRRRSDDGKEQQRRPQEPFHATSSP